MKPMARRIANHFLVAALILVAGLLSPVPAQQRTPPPKTEASQPAAEPVMVARGKIVYRDRCEICHFSESDAKKMGPGLKEIYKRGKFSDGSKVDDASMEKWITNGSKNMPPFKGILKPAQIRDLIAYLRTL
jgi:cytochrome c2